MTVTDDDLPMTDEERVLSERGAAIVAAAMTQPEAQASQALRESIERARAASPPPRRFLRPALAGPALAAALVGLVVALGGGTSGPSVAQVASVSRLPALGAPPSSTGGDMPHLRAAVGRLAFPDWAPAFGWKATGLRSDDVAGRAVTTIAYRNPAGATLGYSIVEGAPVKDTPTGAAVRRGKTNYRVARTGDRTTVTWTQAGQTCVIDAPSAVPAAKLVELASWDNA